MFNSFVVVAALISLPVIFLGFVGIPHATPSLAIADEIRQASHAVADAASVTSQTVSFSIPLPIEPAILDEKYAVMKAADEARAAVLADPALRMPVRIIVPAIGLEAPIAYMGTNGKGEMDVPSGSSGSVGWYERGTVPGDRGSAVIAAHVFAAFSDLHKVPPGSDIYIETKGGVKLHFVTEEVRTYRLSDLSPDMLFERADARRLNLITCAGSLTQGGSTYTHRLVVFTKYVGMA